LIIYADRNSEHKKHILEVQQRINKFLSRPADILEVTFDAWKTTIDDLTKYSAILLWSFNTFFARSDHLGDLMAEYVDRGGGVVMVDMLYMQNLRYNRCVMAVVVVL
jgi:hypothetical protein